MKTVVFLTIFAQNKLTVDIGLNIKRLRKEREIKQHEIADLIGMHRSNYSKIENGQREISIAAVDKIAKFFNITIDELIHLGEDLPEEIKVEDKTTVEQIKLIQELEDEEKNMVFKMIDTFLTKKKFKDFFNKNIAAL
ncbi:MAG: helix-turn-helix transcriptional regulator [Bacteroidales bacterium]|nr:helix-turn-helix transcriptional regulator [Bacteroidales bacterium]